MEIFRTVEKSTPDARLSAWKSGGIASPQQLPRVLAIGVAKGTAGKWPVYFVMLSTAA